MLTFFVFLSFNSSDQGSSDAENQPKYSEVRIFALNENDFKKMSGSGLIIDHSNRKPGKYLDTWLSEYELDQLKNSGVSFKILVDDWEKYYSEQKKMTQPEIDIQMDQAKEKDNVSHSIYGTMGGYLKYSEVVAKLDSMRAEYPQFISEKFPIGNTFQGRTQWVVRVTHSPDAPTGRPEVFYNALIHAREPESMETQMYYFYWLFENYGKDPIATYILNTREIYWLPVLNADGYVYNETTNPGGGGMWRCNRHGSGACGWVDLNRNYGIFDFWNSSNEGSSTDSCSGGQSTYRGKSPFSEIETRNIMNFVNSRNFNTTFNSHTFGNYLLKPWDYIDPVPTPDDNKFNQFLSDMSQTSNYTTGTTSQTLGYFVRGGADDWFYNDSAHAGHNIFGITPETGGSFWPSQSEIIPLAQNMLYSNQYMSLIAGAFIDPDSKVFNQQTYNPGESGNLKIFFKNKGLLNASNIKVSLIPVSAKLTIPVQEYSYPSIASFVSDSSIFDFSIGANAFINTSLAARLSIRMDTTTLYSQDVYVLIGTGNVVLNDNAEVTFANWTTNQTWGITSSQSNSPTHSFTDSPTGQYSNDQNNSMTMANGINSASTPVILLNFFHKYSTEAGYDFCRVEVSEYPDTNWQTVKSYNGILSEWTEQSLDITPYVRGAGEIKIRFRLASDGFVTDDGWYVDDVKINSYSIGPVGISSNTQVPESFNLEQNYPNPFNPSTVIRYKIPADSKRQTSNVKLIIYNALGIDVKTLVNEKQGAGSYEVQFDGSNFPSGVYFYKLISGYYSDVKRMLLIK
ncbi:MAG: M14 family zinc carboxypeptidase [Ignavibacteria bacterium]